MTDVRDRLTDAMSAAAGTVREQDLRPLTAPERPQRRRHQPAWAVPVAAAAAVVTTYSSLWPTAGLSGLPPMWFYAGRQRRPCEQNLARLVTAAQQVQNVPGPLGRVCVRPRQQCASQRGRRHAGAADSTLYSGHRG